MHESDEYEEEFTTTRDELAALLADLATEVRAGRVELKHSAITIPDEVDVELEYEADDGEFELEVTWDEEGGEDEREDDEGGEDEDEAEEADEDGAEEADEDGE
ncbi:amphi-Trp domain-containing protein [Salinirarus marinus]|uniref:amphi-Trp domain-containing protein n=1 Tax=Salinirarus marinus TaxID=3068310 RepID=UPI003C6C7DBC